MQWLIDTFSSLANFIVSMVTGLVDVIKMIPDIVQTLSTSIGYMPDFLIVFATTTLIIMIAYVIAGRGGAQD